ncbi:hypothetical protein ACHAXT_000173 [Thalassiosira profunda]
MCAFLPLSLIPTYVQTRLGVLSKSESEHRALQAGQKCARDAAAVDPVHERQSCGSKNRRPLKTIYWKGLDANPICKILFGMAGFISIDMADNGNGNPNEYNRSSFKQMLNETRKAIDEDSTSSSCPRDS